MKTARATTPGRLLSAWLVSALLACGGLDGLPSLAQQREREDVAAPQERMRSKRPAPRVRISRDKPGTTATKAGNVITLDYGDNQRYGQLGNPQQWVTLHGHVTNYFNVATLQYRLNSGPFRNLNIGPDGRRLAAGDFIIELDYNDLAQGNNSVLVRAIDGGSLITDRTFNVIYDDGNVWPNPFSVRWNQVNNLQDVIQVVDGLWGIQPEGLRILEPRYDRILALGDILWDDYEATVEFTVNGPLLGGFGLIHRWIGHTELPDFCEQPICGWIPNGNSIWYQFDTDNEYGDPPGGTPNGFGGTLKERTGRVIPYDERYIFKIRGEGNLYKFKVWASNELEPSEWTDEGFGDVRTPNGSLAIVVTFADLTVHDIDLYPLPDNTPPSAPGNLTAGPGNSASIKLDWDASTDNIKATQYNIYRNGSLVGSTNKTHYTDVDLVAGQTYQHTVRAQDDSGNESAPSNVVSVAASPFVIGADCDTKAYGPSLDGGVETDGAPLHCYLSKINIDCSGTSVAGHGKFKDGFSTFGRVRYALYDDNGSGGEPGTLLAQTLTFHHEYSREQLVTVEREWENPVELQAGDYWAGLCIQHNATEIYTTGSGAANIRRRPLSSWPSNPPAFWPAASDTHMSGDVQFQVLMADDDPEGAVDPPVCGNGLVEIGEECDDGGTVGGDGCSAQCLIEVSTGTNAVANGDFAAGTSPWVFYSNGTASFVNSGGQGRVSITVPGTNVQMYQSNIVLQGDTDYRLSFRARNTAGRAVQVRLQKHLSPYSNYGLQETVPLTTSMQQYSFDFRTTPGNKTDGRLMFWMAPYDTAGASYYFDDVVLQPLGGGSCGDGTLDAGEQCDDGNTTAGDGCSPTCNDEICGNGTLDPGEACDDGNTTDGDGCRSNCELETCGDGTLDAGEGCDDNNTTGGDGCSALCQPEVCGNNIIDPGEDCDDGNTISGDGCADDCTAEGCGNGTIDLDEACDDGNTTGGDGCSPTCTTEECGNGINDAGEDCDDGNTVGGDGCSETCGFELPVTANVVTNGDFQSGTAPWVFFTNGSAQYFVINGEAKLDISTAGTNVQLFQSGLSLDGNKTYRLTFRARNTGGDNVQVRLHKHTSPFTNYGLTQTLNLLPNWQAFELELTTPPGPINDARLSFWVAPYDRAGNDYWFDDIVLREVHSGCGNGIVGSGETCDDGNETGGDGCSATCQIEACGNGVQDVGEGCDDGNTVGGDGCNASCETEACGNAVQDVGEACDDGNTAGGDGCSATCQIEACGNGIQDVGEECDDGNTVGGDGCTAGCDNEICGNVTIDPGEECDDGNTTGGDGCSATCQNEACGNNVQDVGEGCDDGNLIDGDGCSATCQLEGCGNSIIDLGEECDDGNLVGGDGCSASCRDEVCGNGIQDVGEGCDDGNLLAGDGCSPLCQLEGCGNFIVDAGESCDDGNTVGGDGCSETCQTEACGNTVLDTGEACDDGNTVGGDGCSASCQTEACGNGVQDVGEGCDDGNVVSGDGCSDICTLEAPTNVLTNGDFSAGRDSWVFYTNGAASFTTGAEEARVAVTTQGTNVQLYQNNLVLQPDTEYRVTFKGRNTGGRDVRLRLHLHSSPYTNLGLDQAVDLTTQMAEYSVTFTTLNIPITNARFAFWLAPYDLAGQSFYFDDIVLEVVAPDVTPPSVPQGLAATAESSSRILVTWNAATDNVGVTSYQVYENGALLATVASTSFLHQGLTPATSYSYQVLARDAANNVSALSPAVIGTTGSVDLTPPGPPTGLQATALSATRIDLNWIAPPDADLAGFTIIRDGTPVATSPLPSYSDTGLSPGTSYDYQVDAYDGDDNHSAPTAVVTEQTQSDPFASVIDVWYGSPQEFGTPGIAQPWVNVLGHVSDPNGVNKLFFSLNGGTFEQLSIGSDGRRLDQDGDFNVEIDFADLTVGSNTIVLRHEDLLNNFTDRTVTVQYGGGAVWPSDFFIDWSNVTNIQDVTQVVDGLWSVGPDGVRTVIPGYDRLLAIGDTDYEDYEATFSFEVHSQTPEASSGVGVIQRWIGHTNSPVICPQPHCGWEPNGNSVWYRWFASGGEPSTFGGTLVDPSNRILDLDTTYFIKMRVEGNDYAFKIWAEGEAEPSGWTDTGAGNPVVTKGSLLLISHNVDMTFGDVTIVGLPDTTPPAAPSGLNAVAVSAFQIDLSWQAATDNVQVTGYNVYRGGVFVGTTNGLTYSDGGLDPNTQYSYTVRAIDDSGNESGPSNTAAATTDDAAPPSSGQVLGLGLNLGSGSAATDSSGAGNHGTIVGAGWDPAGRFGAGLDFDGSGDHIDLGTMDVVGTGLTISMWIKPRSFAISDARLISKSAGTEEQAHIWMLSTFAGPSLRFRLKTAADGLTKTLIAGSGTLVVDQWVHVAATFDGNEMRIYQDGQLVGQTTKVGSVAMNGTIPVFVGDNPTQDRGFDGWIDEVKVFSRALSQTEIQAEMFVPVP